MTMAPIVRIVGPFFAAGFLGAMIFNPGTFEGKLKNAISVGLVFSIIPSLPAIGMGLKYSTMSDYEVEIEIKDQERRADNERRGLK